MLKPRIAGIEWLRAIFSIFVVAWHLGGVGRSAIFSRSDFPRHGFGLSDLLNFHILLMAVPIFFLISNYLLAIHGDDTGILVRRMKRVAVLLLFWPVMRLLFMGGWTGVANALPQNAKGLIMFALSGGYSIFYFFSSLLITYGVTFAAARCSMFANVAMLAISATILLALPLLSIFLSIPQLCNYWSPVNFLPYSFAAAIAFKYLHAEPPRVKPLYAILGLSGVALALAFVEWRLFPDAVFFTIQTYAFPAYTRPSLVFSSLALFIFMMRVDPPLPAIVQAMAKYSLSLYCLHLFAFAPVEASLAAIRLDTVPKTCLTLAATIAISYAAAKILSCVWKENLMF